MEKEIFKFILHIIFLVRTGVHIFCPGRYFFKKYYIKFYGNCCCSSLSGEFNRAVVKFMDEQLRSIGFRTLLVAPTDADTSLVARTNLANSKGADAYCSMGTAEGHSIYVYPGSAESKKLAECIAEYLKQGTDQKWRGIKEQNFHVLRETKMASILSENGFMDNPREARLMLDVEFQKEVSTEHVKGICKYFKVSYKEKKEESVVDKGIQLTENQQKDKDVLVRRGYMAKDYKVLSGEMVALITMQAAMVRDLEKNGALK